MKRVGFTRKKLVTYALQRDDSTRQQFTTDVSLYGQESLVFVDKTGTNARDSIRCHGYSLRGKPLQAQKLLLRGEHVSAIAAMSMEGIIALKMVRGGVDGDAFYEFASESLLPHLMPYNGLNKHSMIIVQSTMWMKSIEYSRMQQFLPITSPLIYLTLTPLN